MSNINNKLDYLDETKQLIKQAIIDKGQEVSDEDTFRSYVDKISDIETGNDTKDATATSNDILYPETAYISNGKVTGNIMPTYSSNTTLSQTNTISRSLSYSLLDINYDAKIAIVSDEDYKFNFCNIVNNEIDYENSAYITLNDFEEGMDGTYSFSKCCTNFDKNTNDLYLYLLFTFQNTFKVFCYTYNIKTKSSKYIDTYELTIDDANNNLVLNMMIRPNYPNQVIIFCGYTSTTALGSYLTTIFLQFNTVALELQKIEDTISTSSNQYAALVESCYFTSNGEYLCINVRTGTLVGTTQNGIIYHCVNNFLEQIVDSVQYVTLFENGNYIAYNRPTRNHCLFNVNGDVLYSYSGNLGEVSTEQLTYTNKCILGNYLFGFAHPEDFIDPTEPLILYCCKLNEDYTITKEYEINVGSRTLFNYYNAILYDNKTTRNFDGYLGDTEKEIISLERNNTVYFSTKDSDVTKNDVLQGKIFYNSQGKQIGNKIFTDYNDSVGVLETNAAISATAVDQLIGVETSILPDIQYLDKVKVNDIVKVIITIIDVAASLTTLKCNCLAQILEIIDHSDKQFRANVRILAADVNTEDGTATSEDIAEGKIAYVDNKRVHGIAKLGIDTSDADATPNDILSPKTAYVNGQKIIGAIIPKYDKDYSGELIKHDLNLNELLINNVFCVLPDDIFIVYIDLSDGFKIKVIDSNTSALSEKNITDYAGTESEIPITMKCSNLEDSDGCYNLCLMTRQNKSVFTYIFKLDKSTGSLSSNYSRRTSAYQYIYAPLNCCFANKSANIVTWVGSEDPNNVAIYRINKDCSITAVTYMPGQTDFYWIGAVEFSPDDKYICYNNSHAQDYGCAIMVKLSNNYTYQATLKFQAFTVWVIINASYLVEITNKSAKLYRYNVKSNKINLTYINDVADTPLTEMGKHFTQVSVLANGYYAIQRSEIIYIYKFDENSETVSLVQTIEGFTSSTLNSYSIQYNKDGIISVYTIPHTSYLYSLTKDSEVFYNTKYGSITDDKVLSGYIYFNSNGMSIGTMPNNKELNIEQLDTKQTIPEGYTLGGVIPAYPQTTSDYNECLIICNEILTGKSINILQYIQSSGTQYIDTGVVPTNNTVVEMSIKKVGNSIDYERLFGINNIYELIRRDRATAFELRFNGHDTNNVNINISTTDFSKLKFGQGHIYLDDADLGSYSNSFTTDKTAYLFFANGADRYGIMQLQYCKIWEGDELIRSFIPAKDFDNVICLFDEVEKKFYYNRGTGNFIGGEN